VSAEESEQLHALIRKGKSATQRVMKARLLLKADRDHQALIKKTPTSWD
jgi:hypothetical protein